MALFYLTFEQTIECIVEADSEKALEEAAAHTDPIRDWSLASEWEVSAREVQATFLGKPITPPDPDSGLWKGEIMHIDDYRRAVAEYEAKHGPPDPPPPSPDTKTLCLFCKVPECEHTRRTP